MCVGKRLGRGRIISEPQSGKTGGQQRSEVLVLVVCTNGLRVVRCLYRVVVRFRARFHFSQESRKAIVVETVCLIAKSRRAAV